MFAIGFAPLLLEGANPAKPPGVVIDHSPAASRVYIGSPSIAILPDGTYIASHDFFGGGTSSDRTAIFKSSDRGNTWSKLADIKGQWWSSLFVHRGELYIFGVSKRVGYIIIRRSTDGGVTWTSPTNAASGRLSREAQYHCAPMPVIEYNGRLWRAFEDVRPSRNGGKSLQSLVISAPANSDLLNATNWTLSNVLPGNTNWLGGKFGGWLEGNVVVDRNGRLLNILRVRFTSGPEKAAFVQISADGSSAVFNPATGFVDFPGGAKKFTIRFDPKTRMYWTLANTVPEPKPSGRVDLIRNTLTLMCSPNLTQWTERAIVLQHPDPRKHAFQYADWLFEGSDIIAVSRTAFDDAFGGANNGHDANYLTFHRVSNFRELRTPIQQGGMKYETQDLFISGTAFTVENLANGDRAFGNRNYVWQRIPQKFQEWNFTRTSGGKPAQIQVRAKRKTTLFVAVASPHLPGWEPEGSTFNYNDAGRSRMVVFQRHLAAGQEINVPQVGWPGGVLLFPK